MSSSGRPVAKLVAPVIISLALGALLMAVLAVGGVVLSTRTVSHLTDEAQPAAAANQEELLDLTDIKGAVGDWARSGQPSYRAEYRRTKGMLPGLMKTVDYYAASDPELTRLVASQEKAARTWLSEYAEPRISAPGGPGTYQPQRFALGARTFEQVRSAHQLTTAALDQRIRAANDQAETWLRTTILAVVLLALAMAYGVARGRQRLLDEISVPLLALEGVVQQITRNEADVRAADAGPREVRAVAAALNRMSDEQTRARAVEDRIQDDLRTLDTAKDDFVSNVSHELRTPLTTINGYLEMVADEFEGRLEPRHERMLDAAYRNVARLKQLIDDLLTLSHAESPGTDLEAVDLVSLVRDCVTDVRITGARRDINVDVLAPDRRLPVLADRAMLGRAILNLLNNAVKFSRDHGRVQVELAQVSRVVEVIVRDEGIGIPAAEVDRLGSRFFRASNAVTNEIAGTGLGLRIVQTIVERHDGDLVIESREGQGTTVTLRMRLLGLDEAAAHARHHVVEQGEDPAFDGNIG
ncbi:MAG: sensor histidine kinase [Nocardioides sp.]